MSVVYKITGFTCQHSHFPRTVQGAYFHREPTHAVMNITTAQSDAMLKFEPKSGWKKRVCRLGNWTGSFVMNGLGMHNHSAKLTLHVWQHTMCQLESLSSSTVSNLFWGRKDNNSIYDPIFDGRPKQLLELSVLPWPDLKSLWCCSPSHRHICAALKKNHEFISSCRNASFANLKWSTRGNFNWIKFGGDILSDQTSNLASGKRRF